tara:strand:- start:13818 stop:16301 length:2484 start_codon:yes stop_codon:yes gene_type:complete
MAIEKSIYAAPQGLDESEQDSQEIEIEIITPDMVTLEDGSVEIMLSPDGDKHESEEFNVNLAEELDEGILNTISSDIIEMVESDVDSRKDWADTFVKGLEVLGFKYEERTEPWQDACGVYSTILAEAAIRFQAETMSETFPSAGPVKTQIIGKSTKDKEDAAKRVKADMNYQLTEKMVEYRPEHERMLYSLGLAGSAFKKVYFDPNLGRQIAVYIPAEDVIVPYGASHIETAERVTHVMRKTENEIKKLQANGFYRDIDLGDPRSFHTDIEKKKAEETGYSLSDDNRYTLYEVHADCVLDGVDDEDDDGIAKPYVITIERSTGEILAIRRNWDPEDDLRLKRQHFVHYVYVPGFGFYGLGLIHIIGGYARAGTSIIRQLVDAGTLANLPGGMKTRGLRVKGDDTPIGPGEFRDVDIPSGTLRDNIMPLPYKEPSQVLALLLDKITEEGRRLGAISDMNISDMSANAPVGTTLALLERTLKPMAAVQARVHYAMRQEFKLLKVIIADYAPENYEFEPERGDTLARKADYKLVDVIPVSDPNSSTMAQRVVQYQAVLQMAQQAPQIYDLPQLHRQMIEVLGVKNAEKLVPMSEDQTPRDPVSENMSALVGKPVKAFIYQDHEAHMTTHQAFMQDPSIMAQIGQNPMAQQIMASLQAHIVEHMAFKYRKQIEERLGVPLPAPDQELPEDIELELSRLIADAGKQVSQINSQQAAQAQAQQQAQDPMFQLQQLEMQTKVQEVQRKIEKDKVDAILETKKLELENEKMQLDANKDNVRLDAEQKRAAGQTKMSLLKMVNDDMRQSQQLKQQQEQQEQQRAQQAQQPPPNPGE